MTTIRRKPRRDIDPRFIMVSFLIIIIVTTAYLFTSERKLTDKCNKMNGTMVRGMVCVKSDSIIKLD